MVEILNFKCKSSLGLLCIILEWTCVQDSVIVAEAIEKAFLKRKY